MTDELRAALLQIFDKAVDRPDIRAIAQSALAATPEPAPDVEHLQAAIESVRDVTIGELIASWERRYGTLPRTSKGATPFGPVFDELERLRRERDEAQMEYADLLVEAERLRQIEAAAREEMRTRDIARDVAGRHAEAGHAYTDAMPDLEEATVVATAAEDALRAALIDPEPRT